MSSMNRKRSPVWEYFQEIDPKNAKCSLCSTSLRFDGNASNLKKHLKSKHPLVVLKDEGGPATKKQKKLTEMRCQQYPPSHPRQKFLTQKVMEMISKDMQPVSIVEDRGFQALMNAADPLFVIPSRRTVMRDLLPQMYATVAEDVKKNLQLANEIALTTDLWTSRANHGYIGVTAHFVKDGTMMTYTLATQHFKDDHTGVNISKVLMDIANEWDISERVKLVVTDSASNMVLAMKLTPWDHLPCMAHMLNLVVKDAQKNDEELSSTITKVKDIVGYFHHSPKASSKLEAHRKALQLPDHCLVQECETRWNSTLEMMERAVEQFPAINTALGEVGRGAMAISDQDVIIMKDAIYNLKDFEVVTSVLSGEKFATISSLIPLSRGLKEAAKTEGGRDVLKAHLLNGLTKRFGKLEGMKRVALATLLDPRYKEAAFENTELAAKHKRSLYDEVADRINAEKRSTNIATVTGNNQTVDEEKEKGITKLLGFLKTPTETVNDRTQGPNTQAMAIVETDLYLKDCKIDPKGDPLKFWVDNKIKFPHLYQLALSYICVPATSVPSERLFSASGELVSSKRARLLPQNVDKILFLNRNI